MNENESKKQTGGGQQNKEIIKLNKKSRVQTRVPNNSD